LIPLYLQAVFKYKQVGIKAVWILILE